MAERWIWLNAVDKHRKSKARINWLGISALISTALLGAAIWRILYLAIKGWK